MRKALCGMIAIGALVAAIALAIFSRRQEGHIATCCLACGHNVGGSIHYAFENGRDSTVYDRLVTMRKRWLSPDFLARVYTRACAECAEAPTNDMEKAVSLVEVEIRQQKASVLVRVKASSQEIASACVKALSREIVDLAADDGYECKRIGISQLKRNLEKQERYVSSLRKKLCQLKADKTGTEASEVKNAEDRLISQERILAAMKADVDKSQSEDSWCGFFVEMNGDGEGTNAQ